jgi:hypothetical protein
MTTRGKFCSFNEYCLILGAVQGKRDEVKRVLRAEKHRAAKIDLTEVNRRLYQPPIMSMNMKSTEMEKLSGAEKVEIAKLRREKRREETTEDTFSYLKCGCPGPVCQGICAGGTSEPKSRRARQRARKKERLVNERTNADRSVSSVPPPMESGRPDESAESSKSKGGIAVLLANARRWKEEQEELEATKLAQAWERRKAHAADRVNSLSDMGDRRYWQAVLQSPDVAALDRFDEWYRRSAGGQLG